MIDWNIIGPYIIGAIVTIVGGLIGIATAYITQRPKVLAEAKSIIDEADDKAFKRVTASADRVDAEFAKLEKRLDEEIKNRQDEAAARSRERHELQMQLTQAMKELGESRLEVKELNEVISILRQNSETQGKELESLRAQVNQSRERIRDLEAENQRLRNGDAPKDKL